MDDDDIDYTDMPEWTPAQWASAARGPRAMQIARERAAVRRPAWEAFRDAVAPMTATEDFKSWFTGSCAVTEHGQPEVFYHKPISDTGEFYYKPGQVDAEYGGDFGLGYYLYRDADTALVYGDSPTPVSGKTCTAVLPIYIHAAKPLVLRTDRSLKALWGEAGGKDAWDRRSPTEKAAFVQNLGFDSVRAYKWDQWVVYSPAQIRMAIDRDVDQAIGLTRDLLSGLYMGDV